MDKSEFVAKAGLFKMATITEPSSNFVHFWEPYRFVHISSSNNCVLQTASYHGSANVPQPLSHLFFWFRLLTPASWLQSAPAAGGESDYSGAAACVIEPNQRDLVAGPAKSERVLDVSQIGLAFGQNFKMRSAEFKPHMRALRCAHSRSSVRSDRNPAVLKREIVPFRTEPNS
jgi:hypothetical protein